MIKENIKKLMQSSSDVIKLNVNRIVSKFRGRFRNFIPHFVWSLILLGCLLLGVLWTAGTLALLILVDLLLLDRYFSRRLFNLGSQTPEQENLCDQ